MVCVSMCIVLLMALCVKFASCGNPICRASVILRLLVCLGYLPFYQPGIRLFACGVFVDSLQCGDRVVCCAVSAQAYVHF